MSRLTSIPLKQAAFAAGACSGRSRRGRNGPATRETRCLESGASPVRCTRTERSVGRAETVQARTSSPVVPVERRGRRRAVTSPLQACRSRAGGSKPLPPPRAEASCNAILSLSRTLVEHTQTEGTTASDIHKNNRATRIRRRKGHCGVIRRERAWMRARRRAGEPRLAKSGRVKVLSGKSERGGGMNRGGCRQRLHRVLVPVGVA